MPELLLGTLHLRHLNGARTKCSNNSCSNRYNLELTSNSSSTRSMLSTTKQRQQPSIQALQQLNSILPYSSSSSLVLLVAGLSSNHIKSTLHHKPKGEVPMVITPVRTSWQWRDSIIIIINIIITIKMEDRLELLLDLLMHLPQASLSRNNNSMVQVVISSLSMDTLPAIGATPTSNGKRAKENIDRTMAAVVDTQITMMVGGMAIEGRGIGCPLVGVAPIIIIINIITLMEIVVVMGGVRGVVVEVTEVTSTMVANMIAIMTTGVVGVTMIENDTGDDLKSSSELN
jgi:hypothetical protein